MFENWEKAYGMFNWTVDLCRFRWAADYPGYFNRVVSPAELLTFESNFRTAIDDSGPFEIAGEICFWKNYGNFQNRDRVTLRLLTYLSISVNLDRFVRAVKHVSEDQNYDNFVMLQNSCNQRSGFATPITFLSFYKPTEFPMVDRYIAFWWNVNKDSFGYERAPRFQQSKGGLVPPNEHNWNAYLTWKGFCHDY